VALLLGSGTSSRFMGLREEARPEDDAGGRGARGLGEIAGLAFHRAQALGRLRPGRSPGGDASWNVAFRSSAAALRQGRLLREVGADLVLLQEVNPSSAEVSRRAAGADWLVCAINHRVAEPDDRPVRRRGVAIAGSGPPPRRAWLPAGVLLPERILLTELFADGITLTAVSYHAPPGVSWGLVKPRQAVMFASWLQSHDGPVVLGADANTPLVDAADFAQTRTHWHTGGRNLHGEPGDDLLLGPSKTHPLDDAFRRWLADHPAGAGRPAATAPTGPLAITHRTGRRKNSPGTGRRFDGIAAGSNHAVVVTDLTIAAQSDIK
jgi:hypothetical protein